MAYHAKHFGTQPITDESLAQALFIETQQQEQHAIAVSNGIAIAFGEGK